GTRSERREERIEVIAQRAVDHREQRHAERRVEVRDGCRLPVAGQDRLDVEQQRRQQRVVGMGEVVGQRSEEIPWDPMQREEEARLVAPDEKEVAARDEEVAPVPEVCAQRVDEVPRDDGGGGEVWQGTSARVVQPLTRPFPLAALGVSAILSALRGARDSRHEFAECPSPRLRGEGAAKWR